jgi:hypothetical protein
MDWLIARLKEPSTYQGFATFFTAVGIFLSPELWVAIGAAGGAVIGLIQAIKKERGSVPPE